MRFIDNGSCYSVSVSTREVRDFADRWPCSGMRNATHGIWFQFSKSNGDLVDIKGERGTYDTGAVGALADDAQEFAAPFLLCTNCGGPLPTTHGCVDRSGKHRFCDACAGLAEALAIGARMPVILYESSQDGPIPGLRAVTSWTGAVVGYAYGKTLPALLPGTRTMRKFGPARFRVHMLDGSRWYGTGPTSNGNYIRLRPMKGA